MYAKVDTGAISTVISFGCFDNVDAKKLQELQQYLDSASTVDGKFVSASGHLLQGHLVCAHDVIFDDLVIPDFYYYLLPDNKSKTFLLGHDFIDCCKYSHLPGEDVQISRFDSEMYKRKMYEAKAIDVLEIMEILNSERFDCCEGQQSNLFN